RPPPGRSRPLPSLSAGAPMLDLRYVTQHLDEVERGLSRRGGGIDLSGLRTLADERRTYIQRTETLRAEQKAESQKLGRLMKEAPGEAEALREGLKTMSDEVKAGDAELTRIEAEIEALLLGIPNLPHASVPDGQSEADNQLVRYGERPKPEYDFTPL